MDTFAVIPWGGVKQTTRSVRAIADELVSVIDIHSLEDRPSPERLELNDIARVRLRLAEPLAVDPYTENRATGAFILVDEDSNDTVGAGMVRVIEESHRPGEPHSPGITWHDTGLGRDHRVGALPARQRRSGIELR